MEGSRVVWHGEWADPEVIFDYEGEQYVINYNVVVESMWLQFKYYCEDEGLKPDDHSNDEVWENYAKNIAYDTLLDFGSYNESYQPN